MFHIFPVFLAACIMEVGLTIGLLRWVSRRRYKKFLIKMFTEDYVSVPSVEEIGCIDFVKKYTSDIQTENDYVSQFEELPKDFVSSKALIENHDPFPTGIPMMKLPGQNGDAEKNLRNQSCKHLTYKLEWQSSKLHVVCRECGKDFQSR